MAGLLHVCPFAILPKESKADSTGNTDLTKWAIRTIGVLVRWPEWTVCQP